MRGVNQTNVKVSAEPVSPPLSATEVLSDRKTPNLTNQKDSPHPLQMAVNYLLEKASGGKINLGLLSHPEELKQKLVDFNKTPAERLHDKISALYKQLDRLDRTLASKKSFTNPEEQIKNLELRLSLNKQKLLLAIRLNEAEPFNRSLFYGVLDIYKDWSKLYSGDREKLSILFQDRYSFFLKLSQQGSDSRTSEIIDRELGEAKDQLRDVFDGDPPTQHLIDAEDAFLRNRFEPAKKLYELVLTYELKPNDPRREGILQKLKEIPGKQYAYEKMVRVMADLDFVAQLSDVHSGAMLQNEKREEGQKMAQFATQGRRALVAEIKSLLVSGKATTFEEAIQIIELRAVAERKEHPQAQRIADRLQQGFGEGSGNPFYYANLLFIARGDEFFKQVKTISETQDPTRRSYLQIELAQWARGRASYDLAEILLEGVSKNSPCLENRAQAKEILSSLRGEGFHLSDRGRDLLIDVGIQATLMVVTGAAVGGLLAKGAQGLMKLASTALKARGYLTTAKVLANPALQKGVGFLVNAQGFTATKLAFNAFGSHPSEGYLKESAKDLLLMTSVPLGKVLFREVFALGAACSNTVRNAVGRLTEEQSLRIFQRPLAQLSQGEKVFLTLNQSGRTAYHLGEIATEAHTFMALEALEPALHLAEKNPHHLGYLENLLVNLKTIGELGLGNGAALPAATRLHRVFESKRSQATKAPAPSKIEVVDLTHTEPMATPMSEAKVETRSKSQPKIEFVDLSTKVPSGQQGDELHLSWEMNSQGNPTARLGEIEFMVAEGELQVKTCDQKRLGLNGEEQPSGQWSAMMEGDTIRIDGAHYARRLNKLIRIHLAENNAPVYAHGENGVIIDNGDGNLTKVGGSVERNKQLDREQQALAIVQTLGIDLSPPLIGRPHASELIIGKLNGKSLDRFSVQERKEIPSPAWDRLERGLKRLYEAGIHHNDINYKNIIWDGKTLRLIDFGLAELGVRSRDDFYRTQLIRKAIAEGREDQDLAPLGKLEDRKSAERGIKILEIPFSASATVNDVASPPTWKIKPQVSEKGKRLASQLFSRNPKSNAPIPPAQSLPVHNLGKVKPDFSPKKTAEIQAGQKNDFMGNNRASNRQIQMVIDLIRKGLREKNIRLQIDIPELREMIHKGEAKYHKANDFDQTNGNVPPRGLVEIAEKITQDLLSSHEARRQRALEGRELETVIKPALDLEEAATAEIDAMIDQALSHKKSPIRPNEPLAPRVKEVLRSKLLRELIFFRNENPEISSFSELKISFFSGKENLVREFLRKASLDPTVLKMNPESGSSGKSVPSKAGSNTGSFPLLNDVDALKEGRILPQKTADDDWGNVMPEFGGEDFAFVDRRDAGNIINNGDGTFTKKHISGVIEAEYRSLLYLAELRAKNPDLSDFSPNVVNRPQADEIVISTLPGKALRELSAKELREIPPDAWNRFFQNLNFLNDQGLHQGDINEGNILWDGRKLRLIDFGRAEIGVKKYSIHEQGKKVYEDIRRAQILRDSISKPDFESRGFPRNEPRGGIIEEIALPESSADLSKNDY